MNSTKRFLCLSAAVLSAVALAPAAASADAERGSYSGKTSQPANGDVQPFTGSIKVSLGYLSDPARVTRVNLTARLRCEDGTTRDVRYEKVIAFGPQLEGKGRFVHRDGGLIVRGKFGRSGKARGSFSYTVETCSVSGATWTASHRR
jgi:hypothetical protein